MTAERVKILRRFGTKAFRPLSFSRYCTRSYLTIMAPRRFVLYIVPNHKQSKNHRLRAVSRKTRDSITLSSSSEQNESAGRDFVIVIGIILGCSVSGYNVKYGFFANQGYLTQLDLELIRDPFFFTKNQTRKNWKRKAVRKLNYIFLFWHPRGRNFRVTGQLRSISNSTDLKCIS